jgi:hypothetical protein
MTVIVTYFQQILSKIPCNSLRWQRSFEVMYYNFEVNVNLYQWKLKQVILFKLCDPLSSQLSD